MVDKKQEHRGGQADGRRHKTIPIGGDGQDEGPSIVEWVAHHRNIGFTDIVAYQNSSIDGMQKLLRTMAAREYITYFRNDDKRGLWQTGPVAGPRF
jgi:Glycosyl transferase family 2